MAFNIIVNTLANYKITQGTLDAGDDNFTFDITMQRFWISTPAAAVNVYFASASSGKAGYLLPLNASVEFRWSGMKNRTVTFVGTNAQIITIIEELNASPP